MMETMTRGGRATVYQKQLISVVGELQSQRGSKGPLVCVYMGKRARLYITICEQTETQKIYICPIALSNSEKLRKSMIETAEQPMQVENSSEPSIL